MYAKIKHYAKEIAIFVVVMTLFANAISLYKSIDLPEKQFNPLNATLIDGTKYHYPQGKPLLVHFWATWCPTCNLEASNIETISKDFEVLTIAVKSGTNEEIQKYMQEHKLTFKVINDSEAFIAGEFSIGAYPTTFIYNKENQVVFSEVGYTSTLGLWLRMWWASL